MTNRRGGIRKIPARLIRRARRRIHIAANRRCNHRARGRTIKSLRERYLLPVAKTSACTVWKTVLSRSRENERRERYPSPFSENERDRKSLRVLVS